MKHSSHYLPLAPHPIADRWSARPAWSERAIGAAAAAVLLAGVVSAGLVDSQTGPDGPTLAAPTSAVTAPSGGGSVRSVDQLLTPSAPSSGGQSRGNTGGHANTIGTGSTGEVPRSVGSTPAPPLSTGPKSNPPAPPATGNPPADTGGDAAPVVPALPLPDGGVTVGPVTVDATPGNTASVTVAPGVVAPFTISLP